jgi:hypothetical protein
MFSQSHGEQVAGKGSSNYFHMKAALAPYKNTHSHNHGTQSLGIVKTKCG